SAPRTTARATPRASGPGCRGSRSGSGSGPRCPKTRAAPGGDRSGSGRRGPGLSDSMSEMVDRAGPTPAARQHVLWQTVKLLVTGGAGYIGSVVSTLLVEAGHDVVILDDLSTGHPDAVPPDATLVHGRVHDAARLVTPELDAVLHFAGYIAAGESMVRPEIYWENNVVGSLALLDAVRAAGVPRLVFSSTAAVYGNPSKLPISEQAATAPTNPYGSTKLAIDLALAAECAAHG